MNWKIFAIVISIIGVSTAFEQEQIFQEEVEEVEVDICSLPKEPGPCKALFIHWYYDIIDDECKEFTYGGCQGNGNNFKSEFVCKMNCPINCTLPADPGMCKADLPRYFYNDENSRCEYFSYGGCRGNANNFQNIADCKEQCENK